MWSDVHRRRNGGMPNGMAYLATMRHDLHQGLAAAIEDVQHVYDHTRKNHVLHDKSKHIDTIWSMNAWTEGG